MPTTRPRVARLLLREVGFLLAEIKRLLASRARLPEAWRQRARRKLDQLDAQIAKAEAARHAIEHSLHCPKDDILACPMFWKIVNGVANGQTLTEAQGH
jgi:DNA-binding transcriptional MerR regulator